MGGRWNSPGLPLVYASESLALCLAECLVHIPSGLPADYDAFKLSFPANLTEHLDLALLKADWATDSGYTRAIGDQWILQGRSLALIVPSVILPESYNILISSTHPAIDTVTVSREPFRFDPRHRL